MAVNKAKKFGKYIQTKLSFSQQSTVHCTTNQTRKRRFSESDKNLSEEIQMHSPDNQDERLASSSTSKGVDNTSDVLPHDTWPELSPSVESSGTRSFVKADGSQDLFENEDSPKTDVLSDESDDDESLMGSRDYKYESSTKGHASFEEDYPVKTRDTGYISKGVAIEDLKRAPKCYKVALPPLTSTWKQKVLFRIPVSGWKNEVPSPYPSQYQDQWDDDHVFMPCSNESEIPIHYELRTITKKRWEVIEDALRRTTPGMTELEEAILTYNEHYKNKWNFSSLRKFISELSGEDSTTFFNKTLPDLKKLALMLPHLCTQAIPLLRQNKERKLVMSQHQAACLLANAFFCTFPRRNRRVRGSLLPDINFSNLFNGPYSSRKLEKLKCIFHYFKRVTESMPTGVLSYTRQYLSQEINWKQMDKTFTRLHVSTHGTIENDGEGMLQADFANKYVGGGVLGQGCVQEEIRFMICPEMIVSKLFTEVLNDREVLIMTGCETFSKYTGYSDSFLWAGDNVDTTERDSWGRRYSEVVAMDALVMRGYEEQFQRGKVLRELNKAYCAFKGSEHSADNLPAVCTGNWGCGAFGGDKQLKALIQLMAASAAGRDVCYFTFGDKGLCSDLAQFHSLITEKHGLKINDVFELIQDYYKLPFRSYSGEKKEPLFEFISTLFRVK